MSLVTMKSQPQLLTRLDMQMIEKEEESKMSDKSDFQRSVFSFGKGLQS